MDTPHYLTPRELEQTLKLPRGRAKRLALAGKLPHVVLPGGDIRFVPADVHRALQPAPASEVSP